MDEGAQKPMASPSVSIRESIRWLPDEASEPTSTIVLTSPQRRFVDLRIDLPKNDSLTAWEREDVLPLSRLSWGIAGTSSSSPPEKNADGEEFHHSVWEHWIDSLSTKPETMTDEGDMYEQPDGTTLEKGNMTNPATGKKTDYEEVWREVEPAATSTDDTVAQVVVLRLHDDEHKERGLVVRVGQYCQGIIRTGEGLSAERWAWSSEHGWRRQKRFGNAFLPCGAAIDGVEKKRLKLGGEVKYKEHVWKVIELREH